MRNWIPILESSDIVSFRTMFALVLNLVVACKGSPTPIYQQDLFQELGPPLPYPFNTSGYYRIPSLLASSNGTLLAFIAGRFHRTDATPNIIYLRRSLDDGNTWLAPQPILSDPHNATEYAGKS